jgi:hypothetical protein
MPDRRLRKASKTRTEALENMRAALAANPLVTDPLMASAQVFEDLGRMVFGDQPKKRTTKRIKSRRRSVPKAAAASARKRKKIRSRGAPSR